MTLNANFTGVYNFFYDMLVVLPRIYVLLFFNPQQWRKEYVQITKQTNLNLDLLDFFNLNNAAVTLRFQYLIFVIQPVAVGLMTLIILLLIGIPEEIVRNTIRAIFFTLIFSIYAVLFVSIPFAFLGGLLGGLAGGIVFGVLYENSQVFYGPLLTTFILSLITGLISQLQATPLQNLYRQISSIILGVVMSLIILFITYKIGSFLYNDDLMRHAPIMSIVGGLSLAIGFFKGWRWGVISSIFSIVILFLVLKLGNLNDILLFQQYPIFKKINLGLTAGMGNALLFALLFCVPYLLVSQISNLYAGFIAGVLFSNGVIVFISLNTSIMQETNAYFTLIVACIVAMILGLMQQYWLPLLRYPFEAIWGLLLDRYFERNQHKAIQLLPYHPALWDGKQTLPLSGIDNLLVAAYYQDKEIGEYYLRLLRDTPQNWAVQAVFIELDMRNLEKCSQIEEIATIHEHFYTFEQFSTEKKDTLYAWLQQFKQTSVQVEAASAIQQDLKLQSEKLQKIAYFLKGLSMGGDQNRTRVRNIAEQWRQIIEKYVENLLTIQEIPNPYVVGVPLEQQKPQNKSSTFVGRGMIIKKIEQILQQHATASLFLYGQRRVGKTSLLNNLREILPDNVKYIFIDFMGRVGLASSEETFLKAFFESIQFELSKYYPTFLPTQSIEQFTQADFFNWLANLEERMGDNIVLISLDEFIILEELAKEKNFPLLASLRFFRHIIQNYPRIRLLFSGSYTLEELTNWSSFLVNVTPIHISYLTSEESRQLIQNPMPDFPLYYLPETTRFVIELTQGHPAFIQLLCREAVFFKNDASYHTRFTVTIQDIEAVIPNALKAGGFFFLDIVHNQITSQGGVILQWLAKKGKAGNLSYEELQQHFSSNLDEDLQLLSRRELIKFIDNKISFQVEIIRLWFLQFFTTVN